MEYSKMEYPKMLYRDEEKKDYIIVSSREEHIEKQKEGYHEHDGTIIPASGVIEKNDAVEIAEAEPERTKENTKYKCMICGDEFKKERLLKYHIFKKHPDTL